MLHIQEHHRSDRSLSGAKFVSRIIDECMYDIMLCRYHRNVFELDPVLYIYTIQQTHLHPQV